MKKMIARSCFVVLALSLAAGWQSCHRKKDSGNGNSSLALALTIPTGARTTLPNQPVNYQAVFIDKDGNTIAPASVAWTVSAISGSTVPGTISGNGPSAIFTPSAIGNGVVTASAIANGKTLNAKVAVGVQMPPAFINSPSAIVRTLGDPPAMMQTIYLGTGICSYDYTSGNDAVASVDPYGKVYFNSVGECVIHIRNVFAPAQLSVDVPVVVNPAPPATIPVSRVVITVPAITLFSGSDEILDANVFNAANSQISTPVTWASQNTDVVTTTDIGGSVRIHALKYGTAIITATAKGVTGYSQVTVLADTIIVARPNWIGIIPGGNAYIQPATYTVDHNTKALTAVYVAPPITTSIPDYGIGLPNIATVNSSGLVTLAAGASAGQSTVVTIAAQSPTIAPGVAVVSVNDCDCGTGTTGVQRVSLHSPFWLILNMGNTADISADAYDAANNIVTSAVLKYCSDNSAVCTVDNAGHLIPVSPGTANIMICNGNVQANVTVTVN